MKKTLHVTAVTRAETDAAAAVDLYAAQPAAGFPAPGDDLVEKTLNVNDLLVENATATFFVKVAGDSMEGAGIFDGDYLVVDRSVEPVVGKIVVAAVFGELVVKRLAKAEGKLALVSENDNYQPIIVDGQDDVHVWGVVTGSVRKFT